MDTPILRHQRKFNRTTRDAWGAFAPHRERVMRHVLAAGAGRLVVLGAGNANDLDLPRLLAHFDEVHLVDLDDEALVLGVERQGVRPEAVALHGGVDLSGVVHHLDAIWRGGGPSAGAAVDDAVAAARTAEAPDLGGPFDVVVSACVLSQLVDQVANTVGGQHPRARRLATVVRDRHLALLVELTVPGGSAVLATDVLSTSFHPELATLPDAELPALIERCEREGRFFVGANPAQIAAALGSDPSVASTRRTEPWRWQVCALTLLVCAVIARRRTQARS